MKKGRTILFSIAIAVIVGVVLFSIFRPKIISVKLVNETTKQETAYSDSESLQIFDKAIRTTRKLPGVVDVGPPEYRFVVTYDNSKSAGYSLYLNFDTGHGYLIKDSNSEKRLRLKAKHAVKLAELISKSTPK